MSRLIDWWAMHRVRHLTEADLARKRESLVRAWGAPHVARRGRLMDTGSLPGFVAHEGDEWLGLLTYSVDDEGFEIVTIHVDRQGCGVGQALMNAARDRAAELGLARLWLSTTNDNIRAIRFYQEWGMDLAAVRFDEVARSRLVKPIIPTHGEHGIPIRHELEFELFLA